MYIYGRSPPLFSSSNQKPCQSRSYPIGQRPQGIDRQEEAEESNWPAVPGGGTTDTTTERAQTVTQSQTRHPEPDGKGRSIKKRGGDTMVS